MTKTIKLLEGAPAIGKAIASIATRGKRFEQDVHLAACSVLAHVEKCGDITLANLLIGAVPTLARKNALRDWFINFGRMEYDAKNKTMTYNHKKVTLQDDANATPFWKFKPEAEYVPFDLNAAIQAVLKRAQKAARHGDKVDTDKLTALSKLVAIEPAH